MAKFTLSRSDRIYLAQRGYSVSDINEINYAASRTTYTLINQKQERLTISRMETEERLGRDGWLDALAKSAFFIETTRTDEKGDRIHLHSKVYS